MEPTVYEKIASVLTPRSYQTPEAIVDEVAYKFGTFWKVSNVERRLREMAIKGMVVSKAYKNTHNNSHHNRWKGVTYNDKRKVK